MNYGALEAEIKDRLNSWFTSQGKQNLMVAAQFPETVEEEQLIDNELDKSRAIVQFIDSIPVPPTSTYPVIQDEVVTMRVFIVAARLRGEAGAYDLLEQVKLALVGYIPQNGTKRMTVKKFNSIEVDQNHTVDYMDFDCTFVNVQAFDDQYFDAPIGGPITQITEG